MINLIPKEEKKENAKVFYGRLLILFLFMLGLSIFIGFVSLLPAYFISSAKYTDTNQKLETQKNEPLPSPSEEALAIVESLNLKLKLVENIQDNQFVVSKRIIDAVISNKMPDIKITDIAYVNDPSNGKKVNIEGTAPSREILLSFRLALEKDQSFKQVDLPISNFVKGSDIQFSLSLIPS